MIRAVLMKEYIKLRFHGLVLLLLHLGLMGWICVETRRLFVLDHSEEVWFKIFYLREVYYGGLKYAFLVSGIVISCVQYLSETAGQKLRLSLHLPVKPHTVIFAHVLAGTMALLILTGVDLAVLAALTRVYFPSEAVSLAVITSAPWAMGGFAAYLGATQVFFEPDYRLKLFDLLLGAGLTNFFLFDIPPGRGGHVLLWGSGILVLMLFAVLLPAYRFRYRRVA